MRHQIPRTATSILLLCYAAIPSRVAAEQARPQRTRRKHHLHEKAQQQHQHRLQEIDYDEDYELFLDLPPPSDTETEEETFTPPARFDEDQISLLSPPSPSPTSGPQEATISGIVYSDLNQNEVREPSEEPPVVGALIELFSCSTGSRLGTTRTNENGEYSFVIAPNYLPPSNVNAKACFYIQYDVNHNILPNAIFTTPTNGETPDILLVRGQSITGVDAGAYGATPDPTLQWTTWTPTMDGTLPPMELTGEPTPSPVVIVPKTAPPTSAPVVMMSVNLPLPTDTVALPSSQGGQTVSTATATVPSSAGTSTSSTIAATVLTFQPGDYTGETLPGSVGTGTVIWEKEPIPEDEIIIGKQEVPSGDATVQSTGTINLESRVLVKLEGLPSDMDDDAQNLFEQVCQEFLNDQLEIATPPIYNLDCEVVGQSFDEGRRNRRRRRRLEAMMSLESSGLRANSFVRALKASLTAEVEVTGQVNKTQSVQEPADVKFQDLLVGTFNVQGYQFAEELKEASLSNTSTAETADYFEDVGGVRGIAAVDGAEAQDTNTEEDDINASSGLTKGAMSAIALGGVFTVGLLFLMGMKARRRGRAPKGSVSAGVAKSSKGGAKGVSKAGGAGAKRGSMKSKVARSRKNTKSPSPTNASLQTAPSSPTMASYVAPAAADSPGDVEIGLDPAMAVPPSPQTKRTRVQKTITAPKGKLGLMVANTKGYGPAVHTIRPGSPMDGLIFRNDIITAVNGVDTRNFTAEQITQVMKDTVGEERKITVLSTHR